jgi:hypothetical protein
MKNNNKQISNIELYRYLIKRFNMTMDEAIKLMKKHNQNTSFLN